MRREIGATLAMMALAAVPQAQAATVITAAHMADPVKGVLLDDPVVVVGDDGRVRALVTRGAGRPVLPEGATRIELGDATILPGLIDMHVHLDADATIGGYRGFAFTDTFWTVVGVGILALGHDLNRRATA